MSTINKHQLASSHISAEIEQNVIDDLKKKSVTGAISYFLKTLLLQGLGLVSIFLLSAFFEPQDFGVYGYVTQIIGLLIFFSDVGLAAALVQKKNEPTSTDYKTAFTIQQLLSWLIVGIVLIIVSTGLVQNKVGSEGVWILLALAISFPLASFKTISSIKLERQLKFSKLVIPQIFEQIIFHGILIYFAWKGTGAIAYAWAIIARSIAGTLIMWLIQPWKIGLNLNKKSFKELISFGAKFQLNDFLARIKDQLYFLALGQFFSLTNFGYIQWAKNWSMYPYNLTVQNVLAITFPTFSRLQKRKDLLKKAIEKSIFFITAIIFPILIGMSVLIYPLTQVVPQYAKWEAAVPSFIMFALSVGWAAISTPLVNALNSIGKINQTLKLMIIWTVLTWVITPITIWIFGFQGVALAALLVSFSSILSVIYVKKHLNIKIWKQIYAQLAASIFMAIVGFLLIDLASSSLFKFLGTGLIIGFSYCACFFALGYKKIIKEFKFLLNR